MAPRRSLPTSPAAPGGGLCIAVLVKDFAGAKTRLAAVLPATARERFARETAEHALRAAAEIGPTIAVCGSPAAAAVATACGAEALVEHHPHGQNGAARAAIRAARARGARALLLLSSDLPLVDAPALRDLIALGASEARPVCVAASASGRQGTNALLLRPVGVFTMRFGDASLPRFRDEARRRERVFLVHDDIRLALDVDEPTDLVALRAVRGAA